jgi:hypothetical protein
MIPVNLGDAGEVILKFVKEQEGTMSKKNISGLLFAVMLGGLLWSRAILSLVHIAWFFLIAAGYQNWKQGWKKNPLLIWSICPLFLYLAGWWQDPLDAKNYDYLLTLLVYPVAAFSVNSMDNGETKKDFGKIWAAATVIGLVYPIGFFMMNSSRLIQSYGEGSSAPVLMDNDHLRFGVFLCAGFLLLISGKMKKPKQQTVLSLLLLLLIFFLAVRTAWLMALLICICFLLLPGTGATKKIIRKKTTFFILLVSAVAVAYCIFPTVQKKIAYTVYDWQQYKPGHYNPDFSDGARRAINYTAWEAVTKEHGSGKGWSGIPQALTVTFEKYFAGTSPGYQWPFNQYLFWWMGSGLAGMILFTAWLLYPVLWGWKNNNKAVIAWSVAMAASCFFESNLAFQYGVWLHAWPIALLWNRKNQADLFAP